MQISREMLLKLQNGSDVRGVAMEGIPGQEVNLTGAAANRIAGAFVRLLSRRTGKPARELKIGVGRDSRLTGPALAAEVMQGIIAQGAAVFDCGLCSTPSMFMSLLYPETAFDGSVMITASHLPFNRNGLKFFNSDGGLEKSDIRELLEEAARTPKGAVNLSAVPKAPLLELYSADLRQKIIAGAGGSPRPLEGLHLVVDAGNGAGGFFAEQVLEPLGADISGSQFLSPDGRFPNHIPNPENPKAMEFIRRAVLRNKADLGLIFDTDVDRMSAVLGDGREVNRDGIIAMMAAILAPDYPGSTIVTDSVTSDRLTDFLENVLLLRHRRFKRGYKNVINECKRLNAEGTLCPLAIETSGHGALMENHYLDDGAYLAVKLVITAARLRREGRGLEALLQGLREECEAREYRLPLSGADFAAYGQRVLETFERRAKEAGYTVVPESYEGVRLSFLGETRGWALLRLSLHDPLMPLNIEGECPGDCGRIAAAVQKLLQGFDRLDLSPLTRDGRE